MSKLRSVNTHFWNDNFIIDSDPLEKLLFLYLLTNPNTNMLGIYEHHVKKIAFETGIDKDMVLKLFDRFTEAKKVKYKDGHVILLNFLKNQSFNSNMQISAIRTWNDLPLSVREDSFCEPIIKALEGFERIGEPIAKVEYEYELEYERELEKEGEEESGFSLPFIKQLFKTLESTTYESEKFYNYYQARGWKLNGQSVQDIKALARAWILRDTKTGKVYTYSEMLNECHKNGITTDDFLMQDKDQWVKKK